MNRLVSALPFPRPHAEGVPVAVGIGLGDGVGDGVPTAAAISTLPQPYTLFGGSRRSALGGRDKDRVAI